MAVFFLGVLAIVILVTMAWQYPEIFNADLERWMAELSGAWFAILISGLYLHNMRCPRCGKKYAVKKDPPRWFNFTPKCLNCGLRLNGTG